MIVLNKSEVTVRDFPTTSRRELEGEWLEAKDDFNQALANKTAMDSIYVVAATRLNALERIVKRVAQQKAAAIRKAAQSLPEIE
ncbi:MAG: hypothetical protein QOH93_3375 [Chloroflexia bacterium]|jgi:hypothetical protein|nr:hypothetical protein [Chloroflexia bacterium]